MRRRDFIKGIAGSAVSWPLAAQAQQPEPVRRVGALMNIHAHDPQASAETAAFVGTLEKQGWTLGRNLQIEYRWGAGNATLYRKFAAELVALMPDVILATGGTATGALQQASSTVPIVFVDTTDPVTRGLIASMARPGGNTTGFVQFEFNFNGKWLELLKEVSPRVSRVAVVRDPVQFSGVGSFAAIQTVAPSFGVEVSPIDPRDGKEIERAINAFARGSNDGLIVTASGSADGHRKLIITLAAKHRLPAVYPYGFYAADGGLISYGPDVLEQFRLGAGYVDRILKGEKPADLPVQAPTKLELVINLKTAKTFGLTVPQTLLARADKVIE